jgi:hypothetical protein
MPGDHQDGVGHRDDRFLVPTSALDPSVVGGQVGPFATGGVGRLAQRGSSPSGALAGLARADLAGRLACARAQPAQLASCPAVGKRVMSVPISATMTSPGWAARSMTTDSMRSQVQLLACYRSFDRQQTKARSAGIRPTTSGGAAHPMRHLPQRRPYHGQGQHLADRAAL